MYLLGYDIGSSSVKASLVNAESGKCVIFRVLPEDGSGNHSREAGMAEQNPETGGKT